jgi:hypothetical protein
VDNEGGALMTGFLMIDDGGLLVGMNVGTVGMN